MPPPLGSPTDVPTRGAVDPVPRTWPDENARVSAVGNRWWWARRRVRRNRGGGGGAGTTTKINRPCFFFSPPPLFCRYGRRRTAARSYTRVRARACYHRAAGHTINIIGSFRRTDRSGETDNLRLGNRLRRSGGSIRYVRSIHTRATAARTNNIRVCVCAYECITRNRRRFRVTPRSSSTRRPRKSVPWENVVRAKRVRYIIGAYTFVFRNTRTRRVRGTCVPLAVFS